MKPFHHTLCCVCCGKVERVELHGYTVGSLPRLCFYCDLALGKGEVCHGHTALDMPAEVAESLAPGP